MAAERPRRFAALAAQAPASPAHGLKRAEAQIEQAAVERVNLSTFPKDHPIWQDLHFCPDGPEAMFPDAQEAFAAAAASLGFEVEDTEMQEGGRGTEGGGVSDEWATVAALAGTPSTAEGMKMPTTPSVAFAMGTPVRFPGLDSMMDSPMMDSLYSVYGEAVEKHLPSAVEYLTSHVEDGEFILFTFIWAICMTSCFIYSLSRG